MKPGNTTDASPRTWSDEELVLELGRVHAREFARLLRRAARLRAAPHETELVNWRRDARHARKLAELDGFELPGQLRHALSRPVAQWADAQSLVEAQLACFTGKEPRWSS